MGNEVSRDLLNVCVFVYLNDILIFSPDPSSHIGHVRQALQRLLQHQLCVKEENCEFHVTRVTFLGYVVGEG